MAIKVISSILSVSLEMVYRQAHTNTVVPISYSFPVLYIVEFVKLVHMMGKQNGRQWHFSKERESENKMLSSVMIICVSWTLVLFSSA